MLHQVREYIDKHQLLSASDKVLVGLSGGADSVALLSVLVKLGYTCVALHCNFHLRGEESMRDEAFARAFAEQLHVPFTRPTLRLSCMPANVIFLSRWQHVNCVMPGLKR